MQTTTFAQCPRTLPYLANFLSKSLSLVSRESPEIYSVEITLEDSSFLGLLGGDRDERLADGDDPRLGDLL